MPTASGSPHPAAADLDRGARLPRLIDVPRDLASLLASSRVVMVAAGSIALRMIDSLARMGVGEIRICDPGRTKPESLLTHPVSPEEIGVSKARLGAERARAIAPETRVGFFEGEFEALPMDALIGATQVMIATDRLAPEIAVTQACRRLGLPHLQASVYGAALVAQVRSFPADAEGADPCLACQYQARDWQDLDAATRFSCDGHARKRSAGAPRPTMSLPHLCGVAADLAIGEWLRRLLRLQQGEPAEAASSLSYCGFHGGTTRTALTRNPDCPVEHASWARRGLDRPTAELSPRELGRLVGEDDLRRISLRVEGYRFASHLACDCASHPPSGRFHHATEPPPEPCPECGVPPSLHPLHTHEDVPGGALLEVADRPLVELGVRAAPPLLVRGPRASTLVHLSSSSCSLPPDAPNARGPLYPEAENESPAKEASP